MLPTKQIAMEYAKHKNHCNFACAQFMNQMCECAHTILREQRESSLLTCASAAALRDLNQPDTLTVHLEHLRPRRHRNVCLEL